MNRQEQIDQAFRSGQPYIDRKLFTADKWVAGTNAGGILFSDINEVEMGWKDSFANSYLGLLINALLQ